MNVPKTIAIVLELLIVVVIIVLLWLQYKKPTILKWVIGVTDNTPTYELQASEGKTATENKKYTIWHKDGNTKCVIFIVGGSFMFSDRSTSYGFMNLLSSLLPDYDVISITYPVRFDSTMHEILQDINNNLKSFVGLYESYHAVAFSAGCMLLNTFMNKESDDTTAKNLNLEKIGLEFKSVTLICGILYTTLWSEFVNSMFKKYILTGEKAIEPFNAMAITHTQPYFIISSTKNFLHAQSMNFLAKNQAKSLIYNQDYMTHGFIQLVNLEETQEAIKEISVFITDNE